MSSSDMHVLFALRQLGTQRTARPLCEKAKLSSTTVHRALLRLERRGLVNIHRTELRGRKYIRWIVPVDITWRGRHLPETTAHDWGAVR